MQVAVLVFLQFLYLSSAVELRVGIYNEIPDLGDDNLVSYKDMIEKGFNSIGEHTVDAVVEQKEYYPYGNLNEYLSIDGFDLIEMDTANLRQVVEEDLVAEVEALPDDIMPAAASAVIVDGHMYGFPTLVCGNFLIGLAMKPADVRKCPLRPARSNYAAFHNKMEICKRNLVSEPHHRLLGGKMNDDYGWYLPFLYIDGYIDIHGVGSIEKAVDEVTRGVVDPDVCERLSWYIGCCGDANGGAQKNKCYHDFYGSYVEDSGNVYDDIKRGETFFYFGFSEKLAEIKKKSPFHWPYAAISGPLGIQNNLLQFTDALVINKARWMAANEEKRNAINSFIRYFLSNNLRHAIAMGHDLRPPQVRYLLQATETFYRNTNDVIYNDIFWSLERAVAAPSLTDHQREKLEDVLTESCVVLTQSKKSGVSGMPTG